MKNKKKLIHSIGAWLCALVLSVSVLGVCGLYYADDSIYMPSYPTDSEGEVYLVYKDLTDNNIYLIDSFKGGNEFSLTTWSDKNTYLRWGGYTYKYKLADNSWEYLGQVKQNFAQLGEFEILGCNLNVYYAKEYDVDLTNIYYYASEIVFGDYFGGGNEEPTYNSNLGYLQNISRKSTYVRGALYNYDDESLTYHWYHDTTSTTGVDLTSGNYVVRQYTSMATVTGYGQEDIIEMSDKYFVGEYPAGEGYFSYLEKDYDEKIESLGYEGLGFIDKYLKGYFLLEHNYFQIVNLDTNECGGYVHIYPKDSTGAFGTELNHEGLDENFVVDEDAPSGVVDDSTGSGLTHEDALENADEPKLDDIEGIDQFVATVESYASQVGNVSKGIGALLGALPSWVLGLFGLGVAITFIVACVKGIRG